MSKLKTIVVARVEKRLDRFPDWDTGHSFPETVSEWRERIAAPGVWNPYGECLNEFEQRLRDENGRFVPIFERLATGEPLTINDSDIVDRYISCGMSELDAADKLNRALDAVYAGGSGVVRRFTVADAADKNHVFEFTVAGSADFFDFDDETKTAYGRSWYGRWYGENRKRGFIEFDFAFPPQKKTNAEFYKDYTLGMTLDVYMKYAEAAGHPATFDGWLRPPYRGA